MALVFKIKHQETLRRWVVSESASTDSGMFSVTLGQLEAKVRELFQLPASTPLAMTYVDKEDDVVTLGDDHDLVDACLVQRLNPLRLEVQVLESKPNTSDRAPRESPDNDNFNMETFLKSLFPQATTEAMQGFLHRYAQLLDPTLPIATLIVRAQDGFQEFLASAPMPDHHKPGPSDKGAHHHPYKHPFGGMHSKSMPNRGEHTSPKDTSFHWGVQCDGCGMTPIQGIRYKSSKIPDFDLCSSCFQEKGSESDDYEKIEHPVYGHGHPHGHYRPPYLRRGVRPFMGPPICGRGSFARGPYGWKPEHGFGGHSFNEEHKKLDARFVKDVTIFDGTELAPGTKFTKIWRMSNTGSLPWPQNTQLLHIGGDVFSSQEAVNVELSEDGLACGEEVEVSVDLTAPDKAGRYVSHWRLISPSGQKFGQRVWVTIQVVPQGEQSPMLQESLKGEAGKKDGINVTFANPLDMVAIEDAAKNKNAEANDEMMATEGLAGPSSHDGGAISELKVVEHDINQEMEGFSLVEKPLDNVVEEEMIDNVDNMNTEKSTLEVKLQSMGFTNQELNTFLLNKNQDNMQLTLDDLLVAAGCDGALRDLQEMGFTDQSTNIRLLLKYKGSIKAVVKDLVQIEKQKA